MEYLMKAVGWGSVCGFSANCIGEGMPIGDIIWILCKSSFATNASLWHRRVAGIEAVYSASDPLFASSSQHDLFLRRMRPRPCLTSVATWQISLLEYDCHIQATTRPDSRSVRPTSRARLR